MTVRKIRNRDSRPVCSDIPKGIQNGINKIFKLTHIPLFPETVQLFLNGLLMTLHKDFELSFESRTLIFDDNQIPQPGDNLITFYITR